MPTSYPICLWKPAALFDSHSIFPQPVHACRNAVSPILASGFPRLKPLKIHRDDPSPLVGADKSVPFPQTSAVYMLERLGSPDAIYVEFAFRKQRNVLAKEPVNMYGICESSIAEATRSTVCAKLITSRAAVVWERSTGAATRG